MNTKSQFNKFCKCLLLGSICATMVTSSITANAAINDNLDTFAVQLSEWLGFGKEDVLPDAYGGSLIERMNYMNERLDQVFQCASDGKLLLQSSLATIGLDAGVSSPLGVSDPASFEAINDYLNAIALRYQSKIGSLNSSLVAANADKTMIVSTSGYNGQYDGNAHGISVSADTSRYDVMYGTGGGVYTNKQPNLC